MIGRSRRGALVYLSRRRLAAGACPGWSMGRGSGVARRGSPDRVASHRHGIMINLARSSPSLPGAVHAGSESQVTHTVHTLMVPLDGLAAARARELAPPGRLRAGPTSPVAAGHERGVLRRVEANRAEARVVVVARARASASARAAWRACCCASRLASSNSRSRRSARGREGLGFRSDRGTESPSAQGPAAACQSRTGRRTSEAPNSAARPWPA